MTAYNLPKKMISIIRGSIFSFDLVGLKKLRDLSYEKRVNEIKKNMTQNVTIVSKDKKVGISNTLVSCLVDKNNLQCKDGKLMIDADAFNKCCHLLAKDLEIPYIFETIHFKILDTKNLLKFTRRKDEVLHIKELE